MKKLGKLSINPEKVIKNDELVNLRGGYEGGNSGFFECKCDGAANPAFQSSWSSVYSTTQEMEDDITRRCATGGTCEAGTLTY